MKMQASDLEEHFLHRNMASHKTRLIVETDDHGLDMQTQRMEGRNAASGSGSGTGRIPFQLLVSLQIVRRESGPMLEMARNKLPGQSRHAHQGCMAQKLWHRLGTEQSLQARALP